MRLLHIGVIVMAATVPAHGQSDGLPPWVLALSRIKRQAKAEFERIPNYACLETIDRSQKLPGAQSFKPLDVLRVEVAFIGGKEMFAPEGATQFQDVDLAAFMGKGSFGTGAFSATARNLFVNDAGLTTGSGEDKLGGRATLWYGFKIPQIADSYLLQGPAGQAYAGEEGKFWVDANSLELLRIEDHATDIPEFIGFKDVTTTIVYNKVQIGPSIVRLPQVAETVITNPAGRQEKNVTEFSKCREYRSESLIRFGTDDEDTKPPAIPKKK